MGSPTCLSLHSLLSFFSYLQSSRKYPISSAVYLTLSNVSSGNEFHRLSHNFEENKTIFNKTLVLQILSLAVYIHKELQKLCSPSSLLYHHVSLSVCYVSLGEILVHPFMGGKVGTPKGEVRRALQSLHSWGT